MNYSLERPCASVNYIMITIIKWQSVIDIANNGPEDSISVLSTATRTVAQCITKRRQLSAPLIPAQSEAKWR